MESITVANGSPSALALVGWFAFFYLYFGYGITLGYHRLLTHKALAVPKWLSYLIVSGGYLCLMGSPIVWVGVHRLHHQKADIVGQDPHAPEEGFLHAMFGWMTRMRNIQSDEELRKQVKDLVSDPVYRLLGDGHTAEQAMLCLGICIAWRVLIGLVFGWQVLAVNLLATAVVFFAPHMVNTICHIPSYGYRSHETVDQSRNVWWVGLWALGEGWHNNHHAIPTSARHGFKWYEIDITWYGIWFLEKVGLASKVVRPVDKPTPEMADVLVPEDAVAEAIVTPVEPTTTGVR